MKNKYLISIIAIILVCCLICIGIKLINNKTQNEEVIQFFEEQVGVQVFVDNSYENINEIQEKLQNIEFVKNVRLVSKEETFEKLKNLFNSDLFNDYLSDIFKNEFTITFDIDDVKDFEKLKDLEDNIKNLEGIYSIESGSLDEFINAYETKGIKGIIEIKDEYKKIEEQLKKYNNI